MSTPTIEPTTEKPLSKENGSSRPSPPCKAQEDAKTVVVESTVAKIYAQTNRLTERQRDIIQETFTNMEKQAIPNALNILIRLFSDYPNYKRIWPQFRAIPDSALMCAPELRRHAQVYMKGLRTIIDAMDDDAKLTASLKRIAKAHIKWNIHKSHLMATHGRARGSSGSRKQRRIADRRNETRVDNPVRCSGESHRYLPSRRTGRTAQIEVVA
uniref:GLOBIN domain-containing protein n=1 Tax=Steinernema glaseri TaxID=37863 RepID=A0A1I7YVA0_9BILA